MGLSEEERREKARAASRRSYAKNAEKNRARVAEWRAMNPDKVKAYRKSDAARASVKASVAKRPEYYAAKRQDWEKANRVRRQTAKNAQYAADPEPGRAKALRHLAKPGVREKIAARAKAAKARPEERERLRINKQNRRDRTRSGKLTRGITAKLMTLQRGCCAGCACNLSESGHHLDHIVPLALDGEHADHNMQLLCPRCNLQKNAKDPIAWAQLQGRLL